jgi:hypothetical protein
MTKIYTNNTMRLIKLDTNGNKTLFLNMNNNEFIVATFTEYNEDNVTWAYGKYFIGHQLAHNILHDIN